VARLFCFRSSRQRQGPGIFFPCPSSCFPGACPPDGVTGIFTDGQLRLFFPFLGFPALTPKPGILSKLTGGQIYHYPQFQATTDALEFGNDLRVFIILKIFRKKLLEVFSFRGSEQDHGSFLFFLPPVLLHLPRSPGIFFKMD
jgi:hypothetical protein